MRREGRKRQRGATAVTVALVLLALGGFAALAVNVGHLMMVRGQLQNACDSAALAGARELDGSDFGLAKAVFRATEFGDKFTTDKSTPVQVNPSSDVVLGHWDWTKPKADAFTPVSPTAPGAALEINAVRVLAGRSPERGNPLDVFLSAFSNDQTTAHVDAEAIGVGGGPADGCSVPFVFADCLVIQNDSLQCGQKLVLSNDGSDNMGFTNLEDGVAAVGTSDIIDVLDGNCRAVSVGEQIGVSNGNNLNNNVVKAVNEMISRVGATVTVPVVSPIGGCPAKFNRILEVTGFATFTITRVTGPPNPSIEIEQDCHATSSPGRAGGSFYGTHDPEAGLVR